MRFAERELKPYAEPVPIEELKEGSVYFAVTFVDPEMLIPICQPMVFIGRNLEEHDRDVLYFQDAETYRLGVRRESATPDDDATFYSGTTADHIFEYERALDRLLACSLRRQEAGRG